MVLAVLPALAGAAGAGGADGGDAQPKKKPKTNAGGSSIDQLMTQLKTLREQ